MALTEQFPFYKNDSGVPVAPDQRGGGTFATASSRSAISPCSRNSAPMLNIHITVADEEPAGRCVASSCGGLV